MHYEVTSSYALPTGVHNIYIKRKLIFSFCTLTVMYSQPPYKFHTHTKTLLTCFIMVIIRQLLLSSIWYLKLLIPSTDHQILHIHTQQWLFITNQHVSLSQWPINCLYTSILVQLYPCACQASPIYFIHLDLCTCPASPTWSRELFKKHLSTTKSYLFILICTWFIDEFSFILVSLNLLSIIQLNLNVIYQLL